MPARSPMPQRRGVGAVRLRTEAAAAWPTMGDWLRHRVPAAVDDHGLFERGDVVDGEGRPVRASDPCRPGTDVWVRRPLPDEPEVPGAIEVLFRDDRIVVVDKPPFLATTPRGRHVGQTVLARLRDELGLPDLVPAHRLDRLTSGVLMLVADPRWRGAYQRLFQDHAVRKTYQAVAPFRPTGSRSPGSAGPEAVGPPLDLPVVVRNRIVKERGVWQARVVPGEPNAETLVERMRILDEGAGPGPSPRRPGRAVYRLTPATGRTHQLRVHLSGLGIAIENDPLYPVVRDVAVDDFTHPLQLLAAELSFADPVDGRPRAFRSARRLPFGLISPRAGPAEMAQIDADPIG
ncbi:MAG: pseudouridine synthase [Actinomyces sp.]|nr:pseudouridine synthase [Actinomyces sp.]MCI1831318.1 pseudouridine synthase [Actinomyces sp.]